MYISKIGTHFEQCLEVFFKESVYIEGQLWSYILVSVFHYHEWNVQ